MPLPIYEEFTVDDGQFSVASPGGVTVEYDGVLRVTVPIGQVLGTNATVLNATGQGGLQTNGSVTYRGAMRVRRVSGTDAFRAYLGNSSGGSWAIASGNVNIIPITVGDWQVIEFFGGVPSLAFLDRFYLGVGAGFTTVSESVFEIDYVIYAAEDFVSDISATLSPTGLLTGTFTDPDNGAVTATAVLTDSAGSVLQTITPNVGDGTFLGHFSSALMDGSVRHAYIKLSNLGGFDVGDYATRLGAYGEADDGFYEISMPVKSCWQLPTTGTSPRFKTATSPFPVGDGDWAIVLMCDRTGTGTQRPIEVNVSATRYLRGDFNLATWRIFVRDGATTHSASVAIPVAAPVQYLAIGRRGNNIWALAYDPSQADSTPWNFAETAISPTRTAMNANMAATGLSINGDTLFHSQWMGPVSWIDTGGLPDMTTDAGKATMLTYAMSPELAATVATHQWGTLFVDGVERADVEYLDAATATIADSWQLRDTIGSLHAALTVASGATVSINVRPNFTLPANQLPSENPWSKVNPLGYIRAGEVLVNENYRNSANAKCHALGRFAKPTTAGTTGRRSGWPLPVRVAYENSGANAGDASQQAAFAHDFHAAIAMVESAADVLAVVNAAHSEIDGTFVETVSATAIDLTDLTTLLNLPTTEDSVTDDGGTTTGNAFSYACIGKVGARVFSAHSIGTGGTRDLAIYSHNDDGPLLKLVDAQNSLAPTPIGCWEIVSGELMVVFLVRDGSTTITHHVGALVCVDPVNWDSYSAWRDLAGNTLTGPLDAATNLANWILHAAADAVGDGSVQTSLQSTVAGDSNGNVFLCSNVNKASGSDVIKINHNVYSGGSWTRTEYDVTAALTLDAVIFSPAIVRLTADVYGLFRNVQSGTPSWTTQTNASGVTMRQFNFHRTNPAGVAEVLTDLPTKLAAANAFRVDPLGGPNVVTGGLVLVGNNMAADLSGAIVERRLWAVSTAATAASGLTPGRSQSRSSNRSRSRSLSR